MTDGWEDRPTAQPPTEARPGTDAAPGTGGRPGPTGWPGAGGDRPGPGGRALRVVVAPDSFKGSLTSVEAADAIAAGWLAARPGDTVERVPLADGGAGSTDALLAAGGWEPRETAVHDPLGRTVDARWLADVEGRRAFVEMAEASGLARVPAEARSSAAGRASTRGTGELVRAALDAGFLDIVLGVGGSATTDGGSGALVALGASVRDRRGDPVAPGGLGLADVATVDLDGLDARLAHLRLRIASDVTNPLCGPSGAAAVYGPQKGASPPDVERLDAALAHWAEVLAAAAGREAADEPGAGAAGGTAFAFLAIRDRLGSLGLVPGVALLAEEVGLRERIAAADVVVTGEGRIDAQTAFGKTALGVARIAREEATPCVAIGGAVEPAGAAALAGLGAVAVAAVTAPTTVEAAMAARAEPVARAAERVARLVSLGLQLAEPEP